MIIEDGKGSGMSVGVTGNNRLETNAVAQTAEHFANHTLRQSYNILFSATPSGGDDCFLYIKNTSDIDMILEGFWLKLVASEYIDIKTNDAGTPIGGSIITPANLNTGSGNSAIGTFQNGNNITGLTGGVTNHRLYHKNDAGSVSYNFDQDIIVMKNGVITFYVGTGGTVLEGFVVMNYHSSW